MRFTLVFSQCIIPCKKSENTTSNTVHQGLASHSKRRSSSKRVLKSVKSHSYIYRLFYSLHGHYVSAYVSRRNLISLPLFLLLLLFVFVLFAIFFCHCFALLQFFRTVWPKAFYSGPARASCRVFIFMQFV